MFLHLVSSMLNEYRFECSLIERPPEMCRPEISGASRDVCTDQTKGIPNELAVRCRELIDPNNDHAALSYPPPTGRARSPQSCYSFYPGEPFTSLLSIGGLTTPLQKSSGSGAGLSNLVSFYSKLPKGPAPQSAVGGIKARWFNGNNASGKPLVAIIAGIFVLGYTIDYQSTCRSFFLC